MPRGEDGGAVADLPGGRRVVDAGVRGARRREPGNAVEFSTWATIHQGTGEDWNQVELTLSTAVPSQNATPPELKVLTVTAYEKAPEKKVLVRRDEYVERAQTGSGGETANTGGQAVAKSQGLSVQLQVPEQVEGARRRRAGAALRGQDAHEGGLRAARDAQAGAGGLPRGGADQPGGLAAAGRAASTPSAAPAWWAATSWSACRRAARSPSPSASRTRCG